MPYPVVSPRSRVLPEEPAGPTFLEAAIATGLQTVEQRRQEARQEQLLAEERAHGREMLEFQSELAEGRDVSAFNRQRPFMETPGERRTGEREMLEFGSGMRRQEAAFDQSLRAPFEQWQRNFQERELSLRTMMDLLNHNLRAATEERMAQAVAQRGTGAAGAGAGWEGIPPSVLSSLISQGELYGEDPMDLLRTLDSYFRTGVLPTPMEPEVVEEPEGPNALGRFFRRLFGGEEQPAQPARPTRPMGSSGWYGGGGAAAPRGAAPAPARGSSGAGAGPEVLQGAPPQQGGAPGEFSSSWFSKYDRDVVGQWGLIDNSFFTDLSPQEHVEMLQSVPDPNQYLERLFEVDARLAQDVIRLRGGG